MRKIYFLLEVEPTAFVVGQAEGALQKKVMKHRAEFLKGTLMFSLLKVPS